MILYWHLLHLPNYPTHTHTRTIPSSIRTRPGFQVSSLLELPAWLCQFISVFSHIHFIRLSLGVTEGHTGSLLSFDLNQTLPVSLSCDSLTSWNLDSSCGDWQPGSGFLTSVFFTHHAHTHRHAHWLWFLCMFLASTPSLKPGTHTDNLNIQLLSFHTQTEII